MRTKTRDITAGICLADGPSLPAHRKQIRGRRPISAPELSVATFAVPFLSRWAARRQEYNKFGLEAADDAALAFFFTFSLLGTCLWSVDDNGHPIGLTVSHVLVGSITIMNGGHLLSASTLFVTINYFKSIILFLPKLLLLLMRCSTQTVAKVVK